MCRPDLSDECGAFFLYVCVYVCVFLPWALRFSLRYLCRLMRITCLHQLSHTKHTFSNRQTSPTRTVIEQTHNLARYLHKTFPCSIVCMPQHTIIITRAHTQTPTNTHTNIHKCTIVSSSYTKRGISAFFLSSLPLGTPTLKLYAHTDRHK